MAEANVTDTHLIKLLISECNVFLDPANCYAEDFPLSLLSPLRLKLRVPITEKAVQKKVC